MRTKQFKSESKKLMDMMINSIYTHKEIFLRELISNASDALDKLYFRSLTDNSVGIAPDDFEIRLEINKEARTLKIIDNGCGMSPERLEEIKHKLIENDTSSGKSIGLTNVNSRIKMAYGDSCGLTISSVEGKGTKVSITLPYDTNAVRRLQNAEGSAG